LERRDNANAESRLRERGSSGHTKVKTIAGKTQPPKLYVLFMVSPEPG
jgi:hypothetical protein